jgi:hypothetical protein
MYYLGFLPVDWICDDEIRVSRFKTIFIAIFDAAIALIVITYVPVWRALNMTENENTEIKVRKTFLSNT